MPVARPFQLVVAGAMALLAVAAAIAPVAAAEQHGLHLTLPSWDFTSGTCTAFDGSGTCLTASVQTDGTAWSNLGGAGTYHGDLSVTFGPDPDCNTVDEHDTFTFDGGTLLATTLHEDCRLHGNRIFAPFTITGGTGIFAGASGDGTVHGNAGAPITYNGQIQY
jgi:hypothetical protein